MSFKSERVNVVINIVACRCKYWYFKSRGSCLCFTSTWNEWSREWDSKGGQPIESNVSKLRSTSIRDNHLIKSMISLPIQSTLSAKLSQIKSIMIFIFIHECFPEPCNMFPFPFETKTTPFRFISRRVDERREGNKKPRVPQTIGIETQKARSWKYKNTNVLSFHSNVIVHEI